MDGKTDPKCFSRAIAYVMGRICKFSRQMCTIRDGETDASEEVIQVRSRMEKRISAFLCMMDRITDTKNARGNVP
jgi:hypothetical protein